MGTHWYLLRSGSGAPALNMALDEALLEAMPRLAMPMLRFYGWDEPAASFGYFQKYAAVERMTVLRPLIRRPTAGGVVPHDTDWTYSLMFPAAHEWYGTLAIESYQRVHQWLRETFALRGISTLLAPAALAAETGQCFAGYERHDLLWRGQKIAGAAQRRKREGLLIQGSVQPRGLAIRRVEWERAFCQAAPEIVWREFEPDSRLWERARELAAQKYSQEAYNRRR